MSSATRHHEGIDDEDGVDEASPLQQPGHLVVEHGGHRVGLVMLKEGGKVELGRYLLGRAVLKTRPGKKRELTFLRVRSRQKKIRFFLKF